MNTETFKGMRNAMIAGLGIVVLAILGICDGAFGWGIPADVYYTIAGVTGTQNVAQGIVDLTRREPAPQPQEPQS